MPWTEDDIRKKLTQKAPSATDYLGGIFAQAQKEGDAFAMEPLYPGAPPELSIPKSVTDTYRAQIKASDDPLQTESRLKAAYLASQMYGIPVEQAYDNYEEITQELYRRSMQPKDWLEALSTTWRAAVIGTSISKAANDLWKKGPNYDYESDPLWQQIQQYQVAMPLGDDVKRSLPVEVLKRTLEFVPSMISGMDDNMAGRLAGGAAGALIGSLLVPGLGIPLLGLTAIGAATAGVAATTAAGARLGGMVGTALSSRDMERGSQFYQMLTYTDPQTGQKLNPKVAWQWANLYGTAAGVLEAIEFDTFFKGIPDMTDAAKRMITSKAKDMAKDTAEKITTQGIFNRHFLQLLSDTVGRAGPALADINSNALQEAAQEAAAVIAEEQAKKMTNELDGTNLAPATAREIGKRLVDTYVGAFLGTAGLSIIPGAMRLFVNGKQEVKNAAVEAKTTVKAPTSGPLTGAQTEKFENLTAQTLPAGTRFQEVAQVEGERYTMKAGDAQGKLLNAVTYDIEPGEGQSPGTVTILGMDNIEDPAIARATIRKVAQEYAGWDIQWEPATPGEQALKDYLVRTNPRGAEAGLQLFRPYSEIEESASMERVTKEIQAQRPSWTTEDIQAGTYFFQRAAQRFGMEPAELVKQSLAPFVVSGMETDSGETFGASYKAKFENGLRTVIELGPKANPSTLMHEMTHAVVWFAQANRQNEKVASFLSEMENAFGIQDGNWDAEFKGWTEDYQYENRSYYEAVAYALEDYLAFKKAPEGKEGILAKLAQFVVDLYNGLKKARVNLSPEIESYFDKLLGDQDTQEYNAGIPEESLDKYSQETSQETKKVVGDDYAGADAIAPQQPPAVASVETRGMTVNESDLAIFQGEVRDFKKTASARLARAKIMEAAGYSNEDIKADTGWSKKAAGWVLDRNAQPRELYQGAERTRRTVKELAAYAKEAGSWKDFYSRVEGQYKDLFGEDAELFKNILGATSQAASVASNVALAVKAYRQLKSGLPFTGYLPAVIKNLERIREDTGVKGQKIAEYTKANTGDEQGVAVDRHIAELLYNTQKPSAVQVRNAIDKLQKVADLLGWSPREAQAALWAYNQIRKGREPKSYDEYLEAKRDAIGSIRAGIPRGALASIQERPDSRGGAGDAGRPGGNPRGDGEGADGGTGLDRTLFQGERPIWRYKTEDVIQEKLKGAMPGRQILKTIQAAGVKADEIKWTGLDGFLDTDEKKTPQEVKEFLAANKLQIQEVERSNNERVIADPAKVQYPKYSKYTIPGGENYREILFTLPPEFEYQMLTKGETAKWEIGQDQNGVTAILRNGEVVDTYPSGIYRDPRTAAGLALPRLKQEIDGKTRQWVTFKTKEERLDAIEKEYGKGAIVSSPGITRDNIAGKYYSSSHWDEPNVLAHTRLDDRTTADGKRVLFVEEIQSDWHQEGRRDGYQDDTVINPEDLRATKKDDAYWEISTKDGKFITNVLDPAMSERQAMDEALRRIGNEPKRIAPNKGVPSAPFAKTWHEFVFKRILRMAADGGYDAVAWTTGEQQAERYDLSKQIASIQYGQDKNLRAFDLDGELVLDEMASESELENIIGKEAAEKLVASEPDSFGVRSIHGQELKVGGEGMKGFYDKMLVDFANKYGKKWGAQVQDASVPLTGRKETVFVRGQDGTYTKVQKAPEATVHALPVTDAMLESVGLGQYLFQGTPDPKSKQYESWHQDRHDAKFRFGDVLQAALKDKYGIFDNAINIPYIGPLTIHWGYTGRPENDYHDGYGLAHILIAHEDTDSVIANLENIFTKGLLGPDYGRNSKPTRRWITWNGYRAIIDLDQDGQRKPWLVTAFLPESEKAKGRMPLGSPTIAPSDPQAGSGPRPPEAAGPNIAKRRIVVKTKVKPASELFKGPESSTAIDETVNEDKKKLYQGEAPESPHYIEELKQSIAQGQSFDEIVEFFEAPFIDQESWGIPDLPTDKKLAWYREQYEALTSPEKEAPASLEAWLSSLKKGEFKGLREFMRSIYEQVIQVEDSKPGPWADKEEVEAWSAARDEAYAIRKQIAGPVTAAALAVGAKNRVPSKAFIGSVYGIIAKNPEEYAAIYAKLMGDEGLGKIAAGATKEKYADIQDPEIDSTMSISQKRELAEKVRDKEMSLAIRSGKINLDDATKEYVVKVENDRKAAKTRIQALESEIKEQEASLDANTRTIAEQRMALKKTEQQIDRILNRITTHLDDSGTVPAATENQRKQLEARRERIRQKLVDARDWMEINRQYEEAKRRQDRAQELIDREHAAGRNPDSRTVKARSEAAAKMRELQPKLAAAEGYRTSQDLQTYLARLEERTKLQDEYRARDTEKKAIRELRAYRKKIIEQTLNKPADSANIEYKKAISAIQTVIQHKYDSKVSANEREAIAAGDDVALADAQNQRIQGIIRNATRDPAVAKIVSSDWLAKFTSMSRREIPLSMWEEAHQKVTTLRKIGREAQIQIEQERAQVAETMRTSVEEALMANRNYQDAEGPNTTKTILDIAKDKLYSFEYAFKNARRFLRDMDGGVDGQNVEFAWHEMNRHYREETDNSTARQKAILDAIASAGHDPKDWYEEIVTIPQVGKNDTDAVLRKSDLMALALGFRDEYSRQALLYGNFFSEDEKKHYREIARQSEEAKEFAYQEIEAKAGVKFAALIQAINEKLDESDWALLDDVFEKDSQAAGQRLAEVVAEVDNAEMVQVEHYFPILRKGVTDQPVDVQIAGDALDRVSGLRRPPRNGFTKERIGISPWNQGETQMDLLGTWLKSIEGQEHYMAFAKYGKELDAVYLDKTVQEKVKNTFGAKGVEYLKEYITEVKNPTEASNRKWQDEALQMLRGNLGAAYLGYRVSSVMKQIVTSPWPALPYAGPGLFVEAAKMLTNPIKYVAETESLSTVLKNRSFSLVAEAIKNADAKTKLGQFTKNVQEMGMKGLEWADRSSVAIGWRAIYNKALEEFDGDHQKAMEKADDIILMTQPTSRSVDLAPAYRNKSPYTQAILQFTQALNVVYQNIRYDIPAAVKAHQLQQAIGIAVAYVISGTLLQAMVSQPPRDDEPDEEKAKRYAFWAITQATDSIPFLGEEVTRLMKRAITGEKSPRYPDSAIPGIAQFMDGLYSLSGDDDIGPALEKVGRGLGMLAGAPVSGVSEAMRVIGGDAGALIGRKSEH